MCVCVALVCSAPVWLGFENFYLQRRDYTKLHHTNVATRTLIYESFSLETSNSLWTYYVTKNPVTCLFLWQIIIDHIFFTRMCKNARIVIGLCGSFIFYSVCILVKWWHCWWETETSWVFFFVFFLEGGGCRSYIPSDLLTSSFTSCFPVWIKCLAMHTILYQYYANKQWFSSSVALWFWVTTTSPDPGSQNDIRDTPFPPNQSWYWCLI